MHERSLLNQIALGEDSLLELKTVSVPGKRVAYPDTRDIADELAAVANTHGATFVFGVDDKTKEIKGIELGKIDIVETWLRDICSDSIDPKHMKMKESMMPAPEDSPGSRDFRFGKAFCLFAIR